MDAVDFQSKMLVAMCKAFKVEPSVDGLIKAIGGEPEAVYAAVALLQANAPTIVQTVLETRDRMVRIEAQNAEIHAMLCALCGSHGVAPVVTVPAVAHVIEHR